MMDGFWSKGSYDGKVMLYYYIKGSYDGKVQHQKVMSFPSLFTSLFLDLMNEKSPEKGDLKVKINQFIKLLLY